MARRVDLQLYKKPRALDGQEIKSLYKSLYGLRKSMGQADGVSKLKAKARMLEPVLQVHSVVHLNVPQRGRNLNWP